MFKVKLYLMIILIGILSSCTTRHLQNSSVDVIPLEQLINQLPARDSVESTLLYHAMLSYDQQGIIKICSDLNASDPRKRTGAEYALHGLATYVTGPNREEYRQNYVNGLIQALERSQEVHQKSFIIGQMKIAGRAECVPALETYISHPKLYQPAIQALTLIGTTSAASALHENLSSAEGQNKVAIILALGNLNYEPAVDELIIYLDENDSQIKDATAYALSNIGTQKAVTPLKTMAESNQLYVSHYLRLAEKLGEKGEATSCIKICDEIIENKYNHYSDNDIIFALHLQVKFNPQKTLNQLFQVISTKNNKQRSAALDLISLYDDSEYIPQLIKISRKSDAEIQYDIIKGLADHKNKLVISYLKETLASPSQRVRMISLISLTKIDIETSLPELVKVLRDSLDDYQVDQIYHIMDSISDSGQVSYLLDFYNQYPTVSKQLVLTKLTDFLFKLDPLQIGAHKSSTYKKYYRISLLSEDAGLRLSSLSGLQYAGDDSDLDQLLTLLIRSGNENEQAGCIKTISSILERSPAQEEGQQQIITFYNKAQLDDKIKMLRLLKSVGGARFLDLVLLEVEKSDERLGLAAIRALGDWSEDSALDGLIHIASTHKNEKCRILAQRGALRLLSESRMGNQRAITYYRQIIRTELRTEEKRQILAGLSDIKTASSLELISIFLNDSSVRLESKLTVLSFYNDDHTEREPPEGFISLFNGKNLEGWKGLVGNPVKRAQMKEEDLSRAQERADSLMNEHWHVMDGILYFDGKGSHLCTVKDYSDFELYVDWKIEKDGDSGIYLRGAPQVQIWDPATNQTGSGGLYNNKKNPNNPLKVADKPIGEWNTFHIIMRGNLVTVYLNDTLVVDQVEMENFWERDKPIYPRGQIELQSHFTPLYFRNIFIRELKPVRPLYTGSLFNGTDLEGWQVIGNKADSWQVKKGILSAESVGGGWISTKDQYKDFELELEYRLPEEGNSGVFIRAQQQGDPWVSGIEIQLLDDRAAIHSQLKSWQYTGSLYGIQGPDEPKSKKTGEWQKLNIVCEGPLIDVSLNGELINHVNLIDYMDMEEMNPGIKRRSGHIGLQNHDTKVEFRNIKIREIAN